MINKNIVRVIQILWQYRIYIYIHCCPKVSEFYHETANFKLIFPLSLRNSPILSTANSVESPRFLVLLKYTGVKQIISNLCAKICITFNLCMDVFVRAHAYMYVHSFRVCKMFPVTNRFSIFYSASTSHRIGLRIFAHF